jgi:LPXTG-motif cell wall-anchored protein
MDYVLIMIRRSARPLMVTIGATAVSLLLAGPASAYECGLTIGGQSATGLTGGQTVSLDLTGLTANVPVTVTSTCLVGGSASGTSSATGAATLPGTIVAAPPASCSFAVTGVDSCTAVGIPAVVAGVVIEAPGTGTTTAPPAPLPAPGATPAPVVAGVAIGSGSGNLPRTGQDSMPFVWVGSALVAAGGLLLLATRRGRQAQIEQSTI